MPFTEASWSDFQDYSPVTAVSHEVNGGRLLPWTRSN